MQAFLTEGLCLRLGAVSLFLTIACESLNTVCNRQVQALAEIFAEILQDLAESVEKKHALQREPRR